MSVTYTISADLGATGLTGTAGFVVYNADGTVFQARSPSVSTVAQLGSSTAYIGTFSGAAGAYYLWIWDDGAGNTTPPGETNPGVNVVAVANSPAREGDGTAAAVAAGTLTLDANDPANAANLTGWQIRILSAVTGAGQVGLVASSNTSTHVQTLSANWAVTPTGTIVYELIPPGTATGGGGSGSDTPGTTTLLGRLTSTRAVFLDNLNPTTGVTLAAAQGLYAPSKVGDSMSLLPTALNSIVIETGYNAKQALKVILNACGNIIVGNGTTTVTVGNSSLPTPTTGSNTTITATMTGVVEVDGVPTAVDRTAITGIVLSTV